MAFPREVLMTMQHDKSGHGLLNNLWAQIGLLVAAAAVLVWVSAQYIW